MLIQWRSFELRPKDAPPPSADYLAKVEANRPRLYSMAREQYGLEMQPGPFNFDSRPALIGAKYAEGAGHGPAYHAEVMKAYWLQARDISDRVVLADVATSVGLSRSSFLSALDDGRYADEVEREKEQARLFGLGAVPAMVFADKYLVSGAQPYAVLADVVERIRQMDIDGEDAIGVDDM